MYLHLLDHAPQHPDDPILDIPRLLAKPGADQTLMVLGGGDVALLQPYLPRARWLLGPVLPPYSKVAAFCNNWFYSIPYVYRRYLAEGVSRELSVLLKLQTPSAIFLHGVGTLPYVDLLRYQAPHAPLLFGADPNEPAKKLSKAGWRDLQWQLRQLRQVQGLLRDAIPGVELPAAHLPQVNWPAITPFPEPPVVEGSTITLDNQPEMEALLRAEVVLVPPHTPVRWVLPAMQLGKPMVMQALHPLADAAHAFVIPNWMDANITDALEELRASGLRSRLGAAARDWWWSNVSPNAVGQRLDAFVAAAAARISREPQPGSIAR